MNRGNNFNFNVEIVKLCTLYSKSLTLQVDRISNKLSKFSDSHMFEIDTILTDDCRLCVVGDRGEYGSARSTDYSLQSRSNK